MIIQDHGGLVRLHLVDDGLRSGEQGIDRLPFKLHKIVILTLVGLIDTVLDLGGSLVVALKALPNLSGCGTI